MRGSFPPPYEIILNDGWRWLPGWENVYAVSRFGDVFSVRNQRLIKQTFDPKTGYYKFNLTGNGGTKAPGKTRHQVLGQAWIEPYCGEVVRHLDGDPLNNSLDNLRWGTQSENMYDRVRHGRHRFDSQTLCIRGHQIPLDQPNRQCGECKRIRSRDFRARRKQQDVRTL